MEHQLATKTNHQKQTRPSGQAMFTYPPAHPLLQLQRALGNQAFGRFIQAKLKINQPGDVYEQEADRVANEVMRMPEPVSPIASHGAPANIQRKCTECAGGESLCPRCAEEEQRVQTKPLAESITPLVQLQLAEEPEEQEEEKTVQTKEASGTNPTASSAAENQINSMRGSGQPLPESVRNFFEPRFGYDFGQVRIHAGARAAQTAHDLNARAFTKGQEVIFGAGYYAPGTIEGRRLLAHELTHVVQQGSTTHPSGRPQQSTTDAICAVKDGASTIVNESRNHLIQTSPEGAPDISRAPLDVSEIMNDISSGMSTHPDLFSWLHVMGERSGEVGHAAARPIGRGPDPSPVPTVPSLPVIAHFFPSYRRHTDQRAMIIGGFHGDERPGYEVTDALVTELQAGTGPSNSDLTFHTLIIPRLNRGAIEDELAGSPGYDTRCNRQLVDLNRNFPVTGATPSSPRCVNTARAPIQPETQGVINVINQFQPHRILSTHAISVPRSAGIFADPNTDPTATQLACSMAGLIVNPANRRGNRLTSTSCNPVYPGDRPGVVSAGSSLGAYAPTRSIPGQTVPVITLEAPTYASLGTTGTRTVEAFLRPIRGFITDPAQLSTRVDEDIVRDIEAYTLPTRRLFLTGRLPASDDIYRRILARIDAKVTELNTLTPSPPNRIRSGSQQRTFAEPLPGATPQAQIVFEKFTLTGSKANGWDTLPDRYFLGGNRSRGVDRSAWLAEPSATRLDIILRFSAVPGASRHHWGTEVDFNSTTNAHWAPATSTTPAGHLHALGLWLQANAGHVGFVQAYTPGRSGGHSEEPWHYSFAPIAGPLLTMFNRDIRIEQDVVDQIMTDWSPRASSAGVTLPSDLRTALLGLNLSSYVNVIGPGL